MKDKEKLNKLESRWKNRKAYGTEHDIAWLIKKVRTLYGELEDKFELAKSVGKLEATQEYVSENVGYRLRNNKFVRALAELRGMTHSDLPIDKFIARDIINTALKDECLD